MKKKISTSTLQSIYIYLQPIKSNNQRLAPINTNFAIIVTKGMHNKSCMCRRLMRKWYKSYLTLVKIILRCLNNFARLEST